MRIYTRVVWEWQGDELVQTESDSYEYEGPVDLAKAKGPKNYANLERLYGIQADQAEFLGNTFKNTVAPAYKGWLAEAQDYGSQANQELAAKRAGTAVSGAVSQQQASLEANLASLGINPADSRYTQGMREMGIQGAGQQAAAETTAREGIRDKGFARQQDAISLGMGTPTQASQAANSAANAATANLTAKNQADQNQAQAVGNIAQAGMNLGDSYIKNNPSSGGADGGQVTKRGILRLKHGGYVQRLAQGGFAGGGGGGGFMGTPQVQAPPPPSGPPGPSAAQTAGQAAMTPLGTYGIKQGVGKAAEMGGQAAGSPGVTAFGQGMQMNPAQLKAASDAYGTATKQAAEAQVDKALGSQGYQGGVQPASPAGTDSALASMQAGAGQEAAASQAALEATQTGATVAGDAEAALASAQAAEAALATEATTAAATATGVEAAAGGLGAAGAVAGTAVPVLGAGLALYGIGNAAGWWADGGEVTPGSRGQTGEVDGPGGPKDDEILAALSDGEYVMPKGVVNYFGIKHLENMRKKGLEYEKQMGIA